jgi:segregation and condensation protein B
MLRHPLARPSAALRRPRPGQRLAPTQGVASRTQGVALGYLVSPLWGSEQAEGAVGELYRDPRLASLEAALLLAEEPLSARRLATLAGLADAGEARQLVAELHQQYERGGSAFQVEEIAGGYQLLTRPEFYPWLTRLRQSAGEAALSAPARETLSIVAYRQPVTRADVEAIRGVGSGDVLRQLMEKGLVRLAGRDDSLGRPALYETTKLFLQVFGLKSLKDLPQAEGLTPPT